MEKDFYQKCEEIDDAQILNDLNNRISGTTVRELYYMHKGKESLTKKGVDTLALWYQKKTKVLFKEGILTWEKDPVKNDFVAFSVQVGMYDENEKCLKIVNGTKSQCIWDRKSVKKESHFMDFEQVKNYLTVKENLENLTEFDLREFKLKDGKYNICDILTRMFDGEKKEDPYYFEKGSQKAIRNAYFRLIPIEIQKRFLDFLKKKPLSYDAQAIETEFAQANNFEKAIAWYYENRSWLHENFPLSLHIMVEGKKQPKKVYTWLTLSQATIVSSSEEMKEYSFRQYLNIISNEKYYQDTMDRGKNCKDFNYKIECFKRIDKERQSNEKDTTKNSEE